MTREKRTEVHAQQAGPDHLARTERAAIVTHAWRRALQMVRERRRARAIPEAGRGVPG